MNGNNYHADVPLHELKQKLFQIEKSKYSEVDTTRKITNEDWLVSLVRLPDRNKHQHAFLVLEGKTGGTLTILFIDFVSYNESNLGAFGQQDGWVRVFTKRTIDASKKLLFTCRGNMMDIRNGDRLLFKTCSIQKKHTANILLKNVESASKSPPKYNVLGNTKASHSSGKTEGKTTGHNCYTFAGEMWRNL